MNHDQLAARIARYPRSPLFARLAGEYLDSGRVMEAHSLCESGLLEYPQYGTAHLIIAKCFAAENKYRKAVEALQKAQSFSPESKLLSDLRRQWEDLSVIFPEIATALPATERGQPPAVELPQSILREAPESTNASGPIAESPALERAGTAGTGPFIPEQAGKPSSSVHEAESRPATESEAPVQMTAWKFSEDGRIVSKTLAEIYATQGAYDEAIVTYRLLKRIRPELVPQIDRRIGELEGLSKQK